MTLAHTIIEENMEEEVTVKSEDESGEENDSNESVQDSDSIKSESDSNKESDNEDSEHSENENPKTNEGWADAISKILKTNKPKSKKTLVLSKAKKLTDVVKKKVVQNPGFEIEGEIKEEKPDPLETLDKVKEDPDEPQRKKRKELLSIRVKPDPTDRERERILKRIATRGVVQLFNAVRSQQKDIDQRLEEAGPLEKNKEKALKSIDKRQFLDVLMGSEQAKSESVDGPIKVDKDKNEPESTWSVLRDDFMLSAKFKDWDKQEEDNEDEIDNL